MSRKQMVNFRADPELVEKFREAMKPYYGRLGICFSAALLAFMESDPMSQGAYIKRIYEADISNEVSAVLEGIKAEQAKRIRAREHGDKEKR